MTQFTSDVQDGLHEMSQLATQLFTNTTVLLITGVCILIYIICFISWTGTASSFDSLGSSSISISSSSSSSSSSSYIPSILLLILVGVIIYYYKTIHDWLFLDSEMRDKNKDKDKDKGKGDNKDKDNAQENVVNHLLLQKQVFNVPKNDYVYTDAKAVCSAYGGRLATYEEVEDAYNKGGEWCNYGWTEGQMALFPTQQSTFDKLQTIDGHKNDCGRPGVNGGYMANPNLKFGINCYGVKPNMTAIEQDLMANSPLFPQTVQEKQLEQRVEYWKTRLSSLLVSPFNKTTWSKL